MSVNELERLNDQRLIELERRIHKLYKEAVRDMDKTILDYYRDLIRRDETMKEALDNGEITERQYTQWRLAQIGRGKRFEDLRDKLAERMSNANATAVAYVNDTTPGVYTLNMNYTAYNIEKEYGAIGFTAWNEEAVRRLALAEPDLMPYYPPERALNRGLDLEYGKRQITAQITSSILLGDSIPKIARKLQERLETMNRTSAIRTARTAYTAAQNGGRQATFERAADMGIQIRRRWVATKDMRTRHPHGMADGQIVAVNEPFTVGGQKLMFPGDASLGASGWNLYNCRCACVSVEKEGIEAEPRMMRVRDPATGRNVLVKEMSYAEWYKWKTGEDFTRNTPKNLAKPAKQSIIKNTSIVAEAINKGIVSVKVNADKQSRHIFGHEKYVPGRSYIYGTLEDAQNLINQLSGTGTAIMDSNGNWTNKERVRNEAIIGVHIQPDTKEQAETKNATIVYSKSGSHIIPRREDEE